MQLLNRILQSKRFYIFLIVISIFNLIYISNFYNYKSIYNLNQKEFVGIIKEIKKTDYGYSLTIESKENLIAYTNQINYELGDKVLLKGTLQEPSNNTVLNNFNYKKYLQHQKIYYTLKVSHIELLKKNPNLLYKIKNKFLKYLDNFKSSNFLKAFLLGDTSYLGNDIYTSYQINGICHLLAIGSIQITFLSGLIFFVLKKLKVKFFLAHLIVFIIIFFYLFLTNFQIAIVRVYLYLILAFFNKKLKFNLKPIKLFLITTFITLLFNPYLIYNRGFLYSYSISFILILNQDKLTGNYFKKILKVSLIAFLISLPFNIYFNYEINFLSLIYNLIYVPAFNLIVFPLALLTIICPFLDNFFYQVITILNNLSYFLNHFTFGILILKKISLPILIIYLVIFTYLISLARNKKKVLLIIVLILTFHANINYIFKTDMYMTIDVKQGDSSLLYIDNQVILIDTGGLYKQTNVLKTITMLHSLGINKIDYLILTHGDYDHMGDSFYLVDNFQVKKVIFNNDSYNDLEKQLIKKLEKKQIKYYKGIKELKLKKIKLSFLKTELYDNENDNSNIIYFTYQDFKFLLMGDASRKVEERLLEKYNLHNLTVLKVGHHGSKTSTSKNFIKQLTPKYSIISVGKNNRYHHPNQEVLDNLKTSKLYRTDYDGSIIFQFQKQKLKIFKLAP